MFFLIGLWVVVYGRGAHGIVFGGVLVPLTVPLVLAGRLGLLVKPEISPCPSPGTACQGSWLALGFLRFEPLLARCFHRTVAVEVHVKGRRGDAETAREVLGVGVA